MQTILQAGLSAVLIPPARPPREKYFFSERSRPALGPTQPPVQYSWGLTFATHFNLAPKLTVSGAIPPHPILTVSGAIPLRPILTVSGAIPLRTILTVSGAIPLRPIFACKPRTDTNLLVHLPVKAVSPSETSGQNKYTSFQTVRCHSPKTRDVTPWCQEVRKQIPCFYRPSFPKISPFWPQLESPMQLTTGQPSDTECPFYRVPAYCSCRGIFRPIRASYVIQLSCAQGHSVLRLPICTCYTPRPRHAISEHSHRSLGHRHVQVAQHVVRVLLRAILLEGVADADRLLASRLLGSRWQAVARRRRVRAVGRGIAFPAIEETQQLNIVTRW